MLKTSPWSSRFFLMFSNSKLIIFSNFYFSLLISSFFSSIDLALCSFSSWTTAPNRAISSSFSFLIFSTLFVTIVSTASFSWSIFFSCLISNRYWSSRSSNSFFAIKAYLLIASSHLTLSSAIYETLLTSFSSALRVHFSISSRSPLFSSPHSSCLLVRYSTEMVNFSLRVLRSLTAWSLASSYFLMLEFSLRRSSCLSSKSSARRSRTLNLLSSSVSWALSV